MVAVVAVGVVVIGGLATYRHLSQPSAAELCATMRQYDSAWGSHHIDGGPETVALVGDSYTVGHFLSDPVGESWEQTFARDSGWSVDVDGWSASGYTVSGYCAQDTRFTARVARDVQADHPDAVLIQGGLNDAVMDADPEAVKAAAVAAIKDAGDVPVVLVGPTLINSVDHDQIRAVDAALRQAAEADGATYISALDWSLDYREDGAHPTAAGARTYGDLVAKAFREQVTSAQ